MYKKTEQYALNSPIFKVVNFFLENPYKEAHLRGIARELRISPFSSKKFLDLLLKEGLITEKRRANLRYFKANTLNLFFKHLKISFNIKKILDSGLIDFLKDKIPALSSITLFGSFAKGENYGESDIDLVAIGKKIKLDISGYKKILKREITLYTFSQAEWKKQQIENKAFYQDVISHGTPLYGELPLLK
jgi:predicted nucleotidyltransferase